MPTTTTDDQPSPAPPTENPQAAEAVIDARDLARLAAAMVRLLAEQRQRPEQRTETAE